MRPPHINQPAGSVNQPIGWFPSAPRAHKESLPKAKKEPPALSGRLPQEVFHYFKNASRTPSMQRVFKHRSPEPSTTNFRMTSKPADTAAHRRKYWGLVVGGALSTGLTWTVGAAP
ncbi:hypothetical protein EV138_5073 [Kribbella voronezhensis]|uniref:Uncharacterized protein n=1 Tax=Kribbella voronezhensis TaxID=2512212 RepID=A0A4R7TIW3_9ACTN|nr:hypothetical protein EV138_5073 [Kribbella voronezhensis]